MPTPSNPKQTRAKKITSLLLVIAVIFSSLQPRTASAEIPTQAIGLVGATALTIACPVCVIAAFGLSAATAGLYTLNRASYGSGWSRAERYKKARVYDLRLALTRIGLSRAAAKEIADANCDFNKLTRKHSIEVCRGWAQDRIHKMRPDRAWWNEAQEFQQLLSNIETLQFDQSGVLKPQKYIHMEHYRHPTLYSPGDTAFYAATEIKLHNVNKVTEFRNDLECSNDDSKIMEMWTSRELIVNERYSPERMKEAGPEKLAYACNAARNWTLLEATLLAELQSLLPKLFNPETGALASESAIKFVYHDWGIGERYVEMTTEIPWEFRDIF